MTFTKDFYGRLISYFKQKLGVKEHSTGWLRQGVCPNCGRDKKFGINIQFNRSNCFSCNYHPKPLSLLMVLEGLSTYNEVFNFLKAFESAEYLETPQYIFKEKNFELPESYKLLSMGDSQYGNLARNYMKRRGFDIDKISMKGVGYCTSGKYAGRIIIPYYEAGRLVYFNAREFINMGQKHLNPNLDEVGVGKSVLMYNIDCLHLYKTTYLVESAINALTLGDAAFGAAGKLISKFQLSKILSSPCSSLVIILDPDAIWWALKTALQIVKHKKVKVINFPDLKKDINDYGKKKTLEFVKAQPWQSYGELYKLYLNTSKPDNFVSTHEEA